jgi:predicted Fe-S protein YdhL (DUF1289 family)
MTAEPQREAAPAVQPESQTPVPSPCNSVCRMDPEGAYCIGCFRTLEEIAGWGGFDDGRRRLIWGELRRRRTRGALQGRPVKGADGAGAG